MWKMYGPYPRYLEHLIIGPHSGESMPVKQRAQGLEVVIIYRLGSQRFIIVLAPVLVPREFVIGTAPFLSEGVPVDF